jgi:protein-tyrosine phosphatase
MSLQNILVVCVGNICRSPMAEFFLKHQHSDLHIESAGIAALVGHAADNKAIFCMDACYNINIKSHVARQLDENLLKKADLVLVMSLNQQKYIELTWPFVKGKVFRLGHWQNKNVPDPYKNDQEFFNLTCKNIQNYVLDWQSHL